MLLFLRKAKRSKSDFLSVTSGKRRHLSRNMKRLRATETEGIAAFGQTSAF